MVKNTRQMVYKDYYHIMYNIIITIYLGIEYTNVEFAKTQSIGNETNIDEYHTIATTSH